VEPRVLFIEDDRDIRRVISTALEVEGFVVEQFSDGEAALNGFADLKVDIALIDLRLPGISGLEVVRRLRPMTTIPLVILTAFGDSHDVVAGLEAGADDFLNKPIATKELYARLRAILRRAMSTSSDPVEVEDLNFGQISVHLNRREAFINESLVRLTNTEFLILAELIRESPNVMVCLIEFGVTTIWAIRVSSICRFIDCDKNLKSTG
jgi:DNA-binding response OmpR family regulator